MKKANLIRFGVVFMFSAAVFAPGRLFAQSKSAPSKPSFEDLRNKMVDEEIVGAGVKNPRVIDAMRHTPRHEFVLTKDIKNAYLDMAMAIGEGQTISPPFIVAYMTEALDPQPNDIVLEIGTGSGYQAAVLSPLAKEVYSIEIVKPLGVKAAETLKRLHYTNVHTKIGDGYQGWAEHAPFDKIIVTCSPESAPPILVEQLKEGGRMVIPVGERYQQTMYLMKKVDGKMEKEALLPTLFVPMTGKAEEERKIKPDPTKPGIENGGFEEVSGDPPTAAVWHYQRQVKIISNQQAPEGKNYALFSNTEPGRGSQMLQGFPVSGLKVKAIEVSCMVRGKNLRPGQDSHQLPAAVIKFYDENRGAAGEPAIVGPWQGSFDWQKESKTIPVPPRAREAILIIGLLGGVGELSVDEVEVKAAKK